MPNISLSRNQRLYAAIESAYGTAAAPSNSNSVRIKSGIKMSPSTDQIVSESKTGTRSVSTFIPGRARGQGSIPFELIPSGTAGTPPDCSNILQGVCGVAPTIVAGTSVTFNLADSIPSVTLWNYRTPSTMSQLAAFGSVFSRLTINYGGNILEASVDFKSKWVLDSNAFGDADSNQRGGLSSFPTEPSSPVFAGSPIAGFIGSMTMSEIDGTGTQSFNQEMRNGSVVITTANEPTEGIFSSKYPQTPQGGLRDVQFNAEFDDTDGANITFAKNHAQSQTPVKIVLVIGNVAGSIFTFTMPKVILTAPDYNDGSLKYGFSAQGCKCYPTTATATDEWKMVIT